MTTANTAAALKPMAPVWAPSYPAGVSPDFDVPNVPLFSLLDKTVAKYADRPAVVFAGVEYNYGDIGKLVARAAAGLQDIGVKSDVTVVMFMTNSG